jgi:hypothetical protein
MRRVTAALTLVAAYLAVALPTASADAPVLQADPAPVDFGLPPVGTENDGVLPTLDRKALDVDPHRLSFGRQAYDTSVKRTVTMTNTSQRTLYLTIDALVPDTFSPGQTESTCPLSFATNILEPGQSCTQVVTFNPSPGFPGRQTGELVIGASDGFGNQLPDVDVTMSGIGI